MLHINLSNFELVPNWRNQNKFLRVCMGCYQTLIPYISIGNCNSGLVFGVRASLKILYKNMTSYPIISKKLFLWRHHFGTLLVCFLVEFHLLFVFSVLSCRILDSTSLFIYVHEHDRLYVPMLTVETAVFDCICWLSSSRDRKGQSLSGRLLFGIGGRVLEGTIHKSEPEPRNGDVNTVYFINKARGNTRINRTEFIEPLYGYIRTLISSRFFHQIVDFSTKSSLSGA